jgi:hypothetical protein
MEHSGQIVLRKSHRRMVRSNTFRSLVADAQQLSFSLFLLALLCAAATAQNSARKLNDRYRIETDPVRKARLLARIGPLDMDDAHTALRKDDQAQAVAILQTYRDEVRQTSDALSSSGLNPQRKPAGFKDLQVELRTLLRSMDDLIFSLPVDERAPFEAVRNDLNAAETSLFVAMFPSAEEKRQLK